MFIPFMRPGRLLPAWLLLMAAGCSTPGPTAEPSSPGSVFDRRSIAVMRAPDFETAAQLRSAVVGGVPPASATIVPLGELHRIHPSLELVAARLQECGVSEPVATNRGPDGEPGYIVLQRGGEPGTTCQPSAMSFGEKARRADEWLGELLMGLLVVGLVVAGIALPFML